MLPVVERTPEQLNDALMTRVENLTSDLLVLSGITQRGAVLPDQYREDALLPIMRLADRVFRALRAGEPVSNPWDREKTDAA